VHPGRELAAAIAELARIPAPTFAEEPRLAWVEERLAKLPGTRVRDSAGNLVWRWGAGRPQLLVAAHVDTVFEAGTELAVREEGGLLVGPGVGDNAAAVVIAIDVVGRLLAQPDVAPGAVAFTVGEEGLGNLRGATAACAELAPEAMIALEGHGLEHVLVDAVGSVRARVTVRGPGGHSWVDRGTASAVHALVGLAGELVARSTDEAPVNVGLLSGGRAVNAIADAAELVVEVRSLDPAALERFRSTLETLEVEPPLAVSTELLGTRPAGSLDPNHPLLATVREVRAALGLPDELGDGSTDANAALAAGIPALVLGVARGSGMHTLDERIEIASLDLGVRQLERVLRRLLVAA
jgi:acetylornithine deacetylase/succinyl-diaminopimelate desuccinylase-like protein